MVIRLYIFVVCYITILDAILPKAIGEVGSAWVIFFLFFIAFLIKSLFKTGLKFSNPWIYALLLFSIVHIASVSWTKYYSYDLFTVQRLFAHSAVPFFLAVGAINLFREEKNVDLFIKHLSIAVVILSLVSLAQVTFGAFGGAVMKNKEIRAAATFGNVNSLAAFLVLALPLMLHGMNKKILSKKNGLVSIIAIIAGVFATASRKGLGGIILTTTIYFFLKKRFKYILIPFAIYTVIGAGVFLYHPIVQRIEKQDDFMGRFGAAKLGVSMFLDSPLIGLGYNGYVSNLEKYVGHHLERSLDAHNLFAATLANQGLAGFLPLMVMLFYPLLISKRILSRKELSTEHERGMAIVCIATVPAFCEMAWFSGGIVSNWPILNLFYAIVALAICADMNRKSARTKEPMPEPTLPAMHHNK